MEEDITQRQRQNLDFTRMAKHIDTTADPYITVKLRGIENLNLFCKVDMFGNEELIPVGSCTDGSKVNLPNDCGDVDILIVSNKIILKESLFDYDRTHPAFLHIRVNGDHEKYFKTVKKPIDGIYLPAAVLREVHESLFFVSRIYLMNQMNQGISKDGNYLNVARPSKVGKEQIVLNADTLDALGVKNEKKTVNFNVERMRIFAINAISGMISLTTDSDEAADTEYRNTKSTLHENTSLQELLHKFLDQTEPKQDDGGTCESREYLNENSQTVCSHEVKLLETHSSDTETEGIGIVRDTSSVECLQNDEFWRKGCKACEITEDHSSSEPELAYKSTGPRDTIETIIVSNPSCPAEKMTCNSENEKSTPETGKKTTCQTESPVKRKRNETHTKQPNISTKYEASKFSKLKSADFVPAFKFEGWPRTAEEWLTRPRKWPTKATVKKVLETGCQVVAKRPLTLHDTTEFSSTTIPEERDPYFRLSFALSEKILAQTMTEQQLLCWRVLKAYQKSFLKTETKFLTSYHWKNVVFWVCEDLEVSFWTDDNLLTAVVKCLDYMKDCLQKRYLPFYFVRMNLFDGFEVMLLDSMRERVDKISKKPQEYLRLFIDNPPDPDTYLLDIDEIQSMLNNNGKAKHIDEVSAGIVNGFLTQFPIFCKNTDSGEKSFEQYLNLITTFLSKAKTAKASSATKGAKHKSSMSETFLTGADNILDSLKNENGREIVKTAGEVLKSFAHEIRASDRPERDSENKRKQAVSDSLDEVANAFEATSEDNDDFANSFFNSIHKVATTIHEDIKSPEHGKCTDTNGEEPKEEETKEEEPKEEETREQETILPALIRAFLKIFNALQKSTEKKDNDFSFTNELRGIIDSVSQEIGTKSEKQRNKSAMDIELD